MKKNILGKIVVDTRVMAGKPVVKGTRITVEAIIERLAAGMTIDEILDDFPNLKKEDILAALEYSAEILRGEKIIPVFLKAK